ncbi:Uncharacterised protein [Candidatus Venteria ishoeyi]|uniref:Signal peptidase I n=1 Tax=Candidatus Venteria ishoeyi TaxID=1899563 RepID=A0A1H6F661_9GAMM|nr:Uncharacterised protein [Candidatus Venteria ishoeyi]
MLLLYSGISEVTAEIILDGDLSCIDYADVRILGGNSLDPALKPGERLLFIGGYYQCNPAKTGDLVLYRWGDTKNVAKFVRGVGGDLFAVREIAPDQWRLELNGQALLNSLDGDYVLSEKRSRFIRMFARKIKKDEVLLLGDKTDGSHDSTRFGLVRVNKLAGRLFSLTRKVYKR